MTEYEYYASEFADAELDALAGAGESYLNESGFNADDRAYYARIIREYPWPLAAILTSSPVSKPSIDEAVRMSRRCERVAFDWLLEDIGWQPAPDEQGALLRPHAERVPVACVIHHAHGGPTGWYLRPKIPAELLSWLCPVELRLRAPPAWRNRNLLSTKTTARAKKEFKIKKHAR